MTGSGQTDPPRTGTGLLPSDLVPLWEREQELDRMLENAAVGVQWLSPKGRILWANRYALDLLGYLADEYVGRNISEFHADVETASSITRALAAGQPLRDYEVRLICKERHIRNVMISTNVLLRTGESVFMRCFTRDISARVTLESQQRQTEERYRAFIRNSSEGIWRFELNHPIDPSWSQDEQVTRAYEWGYLAECNEAMARMYGHETPETLFGTRLADLFVRSDPNNEAFLRAFISSGYQLRHAESHEQDVHGNDRYFLNSFVGVIDNGLLVRAWGTQTDITRHRETENALRASEERFSRFMRHLPGAAWIKTLNGHYVYANAEAERIFRISLDILRGRSDFEVFPHETALEFSSNDRRALEQSAGIQTIETLEHDDGTHESVVSKFPIPDERGTPALVGGIAIDITEQRRIQIALAESQERLELATRAARIGTFDWDIPTGRVVWNEQEAILFGLAPGAFEGTVEHWSSLIHKDDLPSIRARTDEAMAQRAPEMDFAFRIWRADNACRWIEGSARFIYAPDGSPLRVVGVNLDITDRRNAELALREGEERLRMAADAGKVGLWDWDVLNDRIVWSDRIYEFHGLPRGAFGGRVEDFAIRVHPDDRENVRAAITRALEDRAPYSIEFRIIRPNGQMRWLSTSARVLYDETGKPVRMLGAVLDTTERRDYEEQLRRSNEELQEFAFVASHDVREPLRIVNTYTELLLRRSGLSDDPDLRTYRRYIEHGVQRMEELIGDLLAYSRVIHSDQEPARADLNLALQKALRVLESQLHETGAEIVSDPLPTVEGEETQLEQVFQNLISNSLKYRQPDRPPHIRVRVIENGQQFRISVADDGIGFDPKYSEHIFGLFKRLHHNEYPGTGLGLAICKRIIERCGGRIWAESTPGVGSTFSFTLPKVTIAAASASD